MPRDHHTPKHGRHMTFDESDPEWDTNTPVPEIVADASMRRKRSATEAPRMTAQDLARELWAAREAPKQIEALSKSTADRIIELTVSNKVIETRLDALAAMAGAVDDNRTMREEMVQQNERHVAAAAANAKDTKYIIRALLAVIAFASGSAGAAFTSVYRAGSTVTHMQDQIKSLQEDTRALRAFHVPYYEEKEP